MSCDHRLWDVWDNGRVPVAEELTLEEALSVRDTVPKTRYLSCATCGLEGGSTQLG